MRWNSNFYFDFDKKLEMKFQVLNINKRETKSK